MLHYRNGAEEQTGYYGDSLLNILKGGGRLAPPETTCCAVPTDYQNFTHISWAKWGQVALTAHPLILNTLDRLTVIQKKKVYSSGK